MLEVLEVLGAVILLKEVEVEGQDPLLEVVEEEQAGLRRSGLTYWPPLPPPPGGQ